MPEQNKNQKKWPKPEIQQKTKNASAKKKQKNNKIKKILHQSQKQNKRKK